jgi:acyl dehydratase
MTEIKLLAGNVNVGDEAPELRHKLTRTDLVKYAGASGDFNPMHHDEVLAVKSGLPSVFGHGMYSMGLLSTALTNWVGIGNLKSFGVRFTKQTWPDEVLVTKIKVTDKQEKGDYSEITLNCEVQNDRGEVKVSGTAVAKLPNS